MYREIIKGGSYYHDPSIATDQYTWQYALIPTGDFEATSVQYEILQYMFIIKNGVQGIPGPGGTPSYSFWEALEIINHKETTGEDIGPGISWIPKGKLEVYDDLLKRYIPLEGVRVYISRNGVESIATTDATGSFQSKLSYKTSVNYKIKWASGINFEIKNGETRQAYLFSTRSSFLPFNVKLNDNNVKQKNIATVYRAAYRAYHKDYLGMIRPIATNFHLGCTERTSLRIAYLHEIDEDGNAGFYDRSAGFLNRTKPNVVIYGLNRSTDGIFSTISHELAHAAHHIIFQRRYRWEESKKIIQESWAEAVAYYITKLEYKDYGIDIDTYANIRVSGIPVTYGLTTMRFAVPDGENRQWWPHAGNQAKLDDNLEYSSLIIDLVDNDNQALYYKLKPAPNTSHKTYPNDDVYGFKLDKIQTALGPSDFADFKNKIKVLNRQYYSSKNTEIEIDTLFNRFEYYWNRRN